MPKMSSIEFAKKVAGYGETEPQSGEKQYLQDLVKLIQSGGWIVVYSPEKNAPYFTSQIADVLCTTTLSSIGYTGIDDTYDITFLFTTKFSDEKRNESSFDFDVITNHAQEKIATLLNCNKNIMQCAKINMHNLYCSVPLNTIEKLIKTIKTLKTNYYLPEDACENMIEIKKAFQSEANAFLKDMQHVSDKTSRLCF